MNAKERILMLRLLEKQKKNPHLAEEIGFEIKIKEKEISINENTK